MPRPPRCRPRWSDRVFTSGFAYGPAVPPPYGQSSLPGRRALVSVTVGAREAAFSDRGIHGSGRSRAGTTTTTCGSCRGWRRRARAGSTCTSATGSEGHLAQPPLSI
ncbi:NAD(P)H-dependent oxidoreductase [Streptomyces sp. NPDC056656]|uniref:NAD(P)H-dependent oxidoreductase n=1 Tax=Streptomyces sp. NPDC056656 TaxID=3345895 RepID=UPI003679BDF7